jgi:hypothetical protein
LVEIRVFHLDYEPTVADGDFASTTGGAAPLENIKIQARLDSEIRDLETS